MKLSDPQQELLRALMAGATLKSHRDLDGQKVYRLHPLQGEVQGVPDAVVEGLKRQRLIDSNQKFPAATYLLTEKGRWLAEGLGQSSSKPLTAKNY
jgi:uncharacterized protein YjhX (UPF0386 family)